MTGRGQRIGIVGGTFDPPHNGHLVVAANAADQLNLDRTLLVVANEPWQKVDDRTVTPATDRLAMVEAAIGETDPRLGLEVSDIEIARGGPTYTADTLAEIDRRCPGSDLWLVTGADVASNLGSWKRLDEIKSRAGLGVVDRGGEELPLAELRAGGWRLAHVPIPRVDVSSSEIRARLRDGRPVDGLVPRSVIRIIAERGLYAGRG